MSVQKTVSSGNNNTINNKNIFQLFFCVIGIYSTFLIWGLVQEPLNTKIWPRSGEKFAFPFVISVFQSSIALIIGSIYLFFSNNKHSKNPTSHRYSLSQFIKDNRVYLILLSFTQTFSTPLATYSLRYISYVALQLSKTCKLIPVLLVHKLVYKSAIPREKQIIAVIITIGVTVFTLGSSSKNTKDKGNSFSSSLLGGLMIFISLFFDGLTNATQDTMIKKNKQITGSHLMVISNGCIFFWNLTYLLLFDKTQLEKSLQVLNQDSPDILKLLLIYSICGALGQVFIFYSLQSFGSIILIMVTVTRKMISMILSIVVYEHKLNGPQIAGIGIVFCGISYEAIMKHKKGSRGINKSSLREKKQE